MTTLPDPLAATLLGGRRRLLARAALSVPVTALAAGAAVWLGLGAAEGARRLGWIALAEPLPVLPAAAGAALLGAAAAAALGGWRRGAMQPGPLALAIDRRAGMDLAYATAVETAARHAPGPVALALLSGTRARAAALDLRRLLPLWVRPLRNVLAAGLVAGGAALALHLALPPLAAPPPAADAPGAEDTRARARDLAERLEREAALRQDPMLAAIARAMQERVAEAAPDTADEELDRELAALTDQARAAFGENTPGWLNERRQAGQMPEGANVTAGGSGPRNADIQPPGDDIFAINMEDIERASRAQAAIMEGDGRSSEDETQAAGSIRPGGDRPAGSSMTPEKIEPKELQAAGRESVGAAADSGKGPADQAGGGSSTLEGTAMAEEGVQGEGPMALPQAAQETGRRIRITLPPSEAEQATAGQGGGAAGGGAGGTTNRTVERPSRPAGSNAAVGRYFERAPE